MRLTRERTQCQKYQRFVALGGFTMSAPLAENYGVFFPEEVELLGRVFRETLASAKSSQSNELLEGLIASEIIGLAKVGERDPHKLQSLILAKLGLRPSR
jgi:hypothetical protein